MPELARVLPAAEREAAAHAIVVDVTTLAPGQWRPDRSLPEAVHLGLMIIEGVIVRELLVGGVRSLELLGRGDVLRPWQEDSASFVEAGWRCLEQVRLAPLSGAAAEAICRHPELVDIVVDSALRRSRSLAVHAGIGAVKGLDRRLMLLFWHLAEHRGRRSAGACLVPLPLTHETIAQLIGARRPSVSAALSDLAQAGLLRRVEAGWEVSGDPPDADARLPDAAGHGPPDSAAL